MVLPDYVLGQSRHWPSHKQICKRWNSFISSNEFQALPPHERLDSALLSYVASASSGDDQLAIFKSLLPGPTHHPPPPTCSPVDGADTLYDRFGNNNFTIHSHLNSFAHGIFPLSSRLFNHSCAPNAAARYKLVQGQVVTMEVVALRDIPEEEEVPSLCGLNTEATHPQCLSIDLYSIPRSCPSSDSAADLPTYLWFSVHLHLL